MEEALVGNKELQKLLLNTPLCVLINENLKTNHRDQYCPVPLNQVLESNNFIAVNGILMGGMMLSKGPSD